MTGNCYSVNLESIMSKRLFTKNAACSRVTLKTIAEATGVSVCTVNKALTGKPKISEAMRTRIIETAKKLGYRRNRLARSLSRPVIRIGAVCPDAWPAHYRRLMDGVREQLTGLSDYRIDAEFAEVPDMEKGIDFCNTVRNMVENKIDGLIIAMGNYPPESRHLLWNILRTAHVPFVLLRHVEKNDASPHLAIVEQDSRACGKWAAELLCLMTPENSVKAIQIGTSAIHDHRQKAEAFKAELLRRGEKEPVILEVHDSSEKSALKIKRLLETCTDLGGIYVATENMRAPCDTIQSNGLQDKIKIIGTGISEYAITKINEGLIQASVYQQELLQGKTSVDILFRYLETGCRPELENLIPPTIVMQTNAGLFA